MSGVGRGAAGTPVPGRRYSCSRPLGIRFPMGWEQDSQAAADMHGVNNYSLKYSEGCTGYADGSISGTPFLFLFLFLFVSSLVALPPPLLSLCLCTQGESIMTVDGLNKPCFRSFFTIIKEMFGRLVFYTYFCRKEVVSRNPYYDSRLLGQELPFY